MNKEVENLETFIFIIDGSCGDMIISCLALNKLAAIEKFKNEFKQLFNHNWKVIKVDQFIC